MSRRRQLTVAMLSTATVLAVAVPAAGAAYQRNARPAVGAEAAGTTSAPARAAFGTVKGRIETAHPLKRVDIVIYEQETAEDGSKGWVANDDQFANGGYGLDLNPKTGAYSFEIKPGIYRLEVNGAYGSGSEWGTVSYGPDKPSAAAFGKSIRVRKGKVIKGINIRATGDFGSIKEPDPAPSLSPYDPTAGGSESVTLGRWPSGTRFTYTWQLGASQKYLSFKPTVKVPATAAGKTISVDIYAHGYGKNGAGVSITTGVAK